VEGRNGMKVERYVELVSKSRKWEVVLGSERENREVEGKCRK
jgi:hypothetical protein